MSHACLVSSCQPLLFSLIEFLCFRDVTALCLKTQTRATEAQQKLFALSIARTKATRLIQTYLLLSMPKACNGRLPNESRMKPCRLTLAFAITASAPYSRRHGYGRQIVCVLLYYLAVVVFEIRNIHVPREQQSLRACVQTVHSVHSQR